LPPFALTPLIIATALFMENLDGSALATTLPAMAADLHEDPIALKLALTSYYLALAVFIPLSGWAADKFGARKVFVSAILIFVAASICCGMSTTLAGVVSSRVLQGAGGAMMVPVGRLVLLRSAERHELVRALAYLTIPALIGPLIGPPVGGFIATYFHWRYIFWMNAPIGALGVVLSLLYIPDVREENPPPLDARGAVLSGAGLSCLVSGFSVAGRGFAPIWVAASLALAGGAALLAYMRHARRAAFPILDLTLFRVSTFRAGVVGGFLFRVGAGAMSFLLPLLLQVGFGLSAYDAGLLTFVAAAGAIAMKVAAQPILRAFGFRRVLIVNTLLCAAFLTANAAFSPQTPHFAIMAVLLVGGFFRSLEFTSLNAICIADIDRGIMSRATSLSAVAQQLSSSAGVAIGAAALEAARALHGGGELLWGDFGPAFFVVAFASLGALPFFTALSETAGDEVAGRARPA
jgi:EmrB/QacA subfamily drug resistance transporter